MLGYLQDMAGEHPSSPVPYLNASKAEQHWHNFLHWQGKGVDPKAWQELVGFLSYPSLGSPQKADSYAIKNHSIGTHTTESAKHSAHKPWQSTGCHNQSPLFPVAAKPPLMYSSHPPPPALDRPQPGYPIVQ